MYHKLFYGNSEKDSGLLYGKPRAIRSDEWQGWSARTIQEKEVGYSKNNPNLGLGKDVALQIDVPYKDWSTIFKPHNWAFFILPLDNAFAFRWWLPLLVLMVSAYFFALRILGNRRRSLSVGIAIVIGLSPFFLWWYQTAVLGTVAYGFLYLILLHRLFQREHALSIKSKDVSSGLYVIMLAYTMACFGLLFYPPFQIPIAIALGAYTLGFFLHLWKQRGLKYTFKPLALLSVPILVTILVGLAYLFTNLQAVHALNDSVYPGARVIHAGRSSSLFVFDTFLMPVLQSDSRAGHFFINQSEASNFILLLPFLILPGFALLIYELRKHQKIDWIFWAIQLCGTLFLLRFFLPIGDFVYKFLLLDRVPLQRMLIGMGFVGFLQLIYLVKKIGEIDLKPKYLALISFTYCLLLCLPILIFYAIRITRNYPMFIHNMGIVLVLVGGFTTIVGLLLANKPRLAVASLLLFSIGSSFRIMPLYHGLGLLKANSVYDAIRQTSSPNDRWAVVDNPVFEDFPAQAGRVDITGGQIYPQTKLWEGVAGSKYSSIYNREGHVVLSSDPLMDQPIKLIANNAFNVRLSCGDFLKKNIDYLLVTHTLSGYPCLTQKQTVVTYPMVKFYIYEVR